MHTKELTAEQLDAQLREADARLDVLQARAESHEAQDDVGELSGLRATRARVSQQLADVRRRASADGEAARRDAETALHDLQDGIARVEARYSA